MPQVLVNGCQFHYEIDDFTDPWVPAETIWIQHGFGRSGRFWYQWVPPLAREYRVIRRDMRGHGQSEDPGNGYPWTIDGLVSDMKGFLDELGLDSVHYVGESVGAMLGVVFASRWPERLKSLTLCSMALSMPSSEVQAGRLSAGNLDWHTALGEIGVGAWAKAQMVPGKFAGADGDPARREWLVQEWDKTPRHVAQELQSAVMNFDVEPLLSGIHVPTLVLAPTRSALQPLARQVRIFETIPGARIATIDAPGHETYFDNPVDGTAALLHFVRSLR